MDYDNHHALATIHLLALAVAIIHLLEQRIINPPHSTLIHHLQVIEGDPVGAQSQDCAFDGRSFQVLSKYVESAPPDGCTRGVFASEGAGGDKVGKWCRWSPLTFCKTRHRHPLRLSPLSFSLSPTRYSLGPTDGTIAIIDDFLGNDGEWPFVSHCLAYEYLTPTSASACFVGTSAASHHFKSRFLTS